MGMTPQEEVESGCISRAAADEPVFVLRSKDKYAPTLVRLWAQLVALEGGYNDKTKAAVDLADAMEDWQLINGSKLPD